MLVRGATDFFGATDEYGHGLFLATDEHGLARMKRSGGGIVSREDAKGDGGWGAVLVLGLGCLFVAGAWLRCWCEVPRIF